MTLNDWALELADLDDRDRMETIVELAETLPPLSADRQAAPLPESCRVQECQTPVYLFAEVREGLLILEADVPRKSPIVRGLVALVVTSLNQQPVNQLQDLPLDLLEKLHLTSALGMTRQQGVRGLMQRIRQAIEQSN